LHDDGDGDIRPLNGYVIKIIRYGDAERTQKKAIGEIMDWELDALPALADRESGKQDQQRECGAGLRENERIDWTPRGRAQRQPSGEDSAAEGG